MRKDCIDCPVEEYCELPEDKGCCFGRYNCQCPKQCAWREECRQHTKETAEGCLLTWIEQE